MQENNLVKFTVTDAAMRPASSKQQCFYCGQLIGLEHKADCVLRRKKVKIKLTAEYEIDVPNNWDKNQIEFHRNEGSWCSTNIINELQDISDNGGCLCGIVRSEYLSDTGEEFLKEL